MKKLDIVLVFPPQWSPFQPPLSLPSLHAWISNKGFSLKSYDLNIEFYWWLLSKNCSSLLLKHVESKKISKNIRDAYRLILSRSAIIKDDIEKVLTGKFDSDIELLERYLFAIKELEIYCMTISDIEESFYISPYHFRIVNDSLKIENIEKFLRNTPDIINDFIKLEVDRMLKKTESLSVGISCVGQEQLVFSLLIGKRIKELSNLPVIIGGTVLPRIFRRGTLPDEWFKKYFDIVVVNEGEKPLEHLLNYFNNRKISLSEIEGIVFYDSYA